MKKLCALLLIAALVLSMAGCSSPPKNPNDGVYIDYASDVCRTPDELAEYAASDKAPDDFISCEALSIIGDFNNFMQYTPHYDSYRYNLIDEKQWEITVVIGRKHNYHLPKKVLWPSLSMDNMASLGNDKTGRIQRDNIIYCYYDGLLKEIVLYVDDLRVDIELKGGVMDYPIDENGNYTTFIERLVFGTRKEALSAAYEFSGHFRANR